MSEENVEIVRRYLKATEVLPPEKVPAWGARFWESDGDYYPAATRPCHGWVDVVAFLTGLEEPGALFAGSNEPWDYGTVINDARAIGDDRVYVHGQMWAKG